MERSRAGELFLANIKLKRSFYSKEILGKNLKKIRDIVMLIHLISCSMSVFCNTLIIL